MLCPTLLRSELSEIRKLIIVYAFIFAYLEASAACLFLTHNLMLLSGAVVHIVEIDPLVISASTQAMGFPHFSVMSPSGERVLSEPDPISEVFWKGVHERLFLFESDAEEFIQNANKIYDMVFVDAYDGDDIFPYKLRDPNSPFLKALKNRLNTEHGTVVVNLHSDSDILDNVGSIPSPTMGRYVSGVCRAYKDVVAGNGRCGLGFTVSAPWVCNTSLAVCRGFRTDGGSLDRDKVLNTLISKSLEVENVMDLPFSCLQYIKRGFILAD
ncbi:hypothetical protein CK203_035872 [Vitis vinifera]|uniref:Spermine synthase n=1 Tax=Vitis vinifera TaxID=29760 RepID=A0A438I075_VITVI|nr:hypothetical protein CK203_035872 [Vitis vinifera]